MSRHCITPGFLDKPRRLALFVAVALVAALAGCRDGRIDKGNSCLRLGDYAMAEQFFGAALQSNPSRFEARLGLGKALIQKGAALNDTGAWRMALVHLEAARTLSPGAEIGPLLCEAWYQRARNLLAAGDTLNALEAISRSIEHDPRNIEPVNTAGIVYFRLGSVDKAEALFSKALSVDSLHASARFNLGMVRWFKGDVPGARVHWLVALKQRPGDQDLLYWFALAEKKAREGS